MKPFPTLTKQGQILRVRRLAEKALCDFGIEDAALVPLEHMANTTFRVETADGGRYVMRIEAPTSSTALPPRTEDQVRSLLNEEALEKAWAEGKAMSLEQAIKYALES